MRNWTKHLPTQNYYVSTRAVSVNTGQLTLSTHSSVSALFFTSLSKTISCKLYLYPVCTLVAECGHFHFDLLCNGTLEQRVCWVKDLISSQILNCSEISQEVSSPPPLRLPPSLPSSSSSSVLLFRLLSLRLSFLSAGTQTGGVQRGKWRKKKKLEEQKWGGGGRGGGGWLVSVNILEAASTYFFKMHSTTSAAEFSWYESAGLPWHIFLSVCLTMWHTLKCLTFYFNLLSLFSKRRYIFIIRVFTKAISPRTRYCQSKSRYSIHFLRINFTLCIHWTLNIAC